MSYQKILKMPFRKVYQLLINKAQRKNQSIDDVYTLTTWLLGYSKDEIIGLMNTDIDYEYFFLNAPNINPERHIIKGKICGVDVSSIEDPLIQNIRYLDKLIDLLSKGKNIKEITKCPKQQQ